MRLIRVLRKHGFFASVGLFFKKFITISYGYKLILEHSLPNINCYKSFSLCRMTIEDLELIYRLYPEEISSKKYQILKKRIIDINKKEVIPYVVKDDDNNIYGYYHLSFTNTFDSTINTFVQVDKNSAYLFDDYTFREFRGMGSHSYSILSRLEQARELGYKNAIVNILKGNKFSEKSYSKFGFKRYIEYIYVHIGPLKKTFTIRW
jgi:L-amino acid N-acyltransferase YncA